MTARSPARRHVYRGQTGTQTGTGCILATSGENLLPTGYDR
jgi:hypothetical protein